MRVKKIKGHQFSVEIDCNGENLNFLQEATRNKCHASSNKCLTSSNKDASARQPLAKTVSKLSSEEVLMMWWFDLLRDGKLSKPPQQF